MAIRPNDTLRAPVVDPDLSMSSEPFAEDTVRENARLRNARIDSELQADPELDEGSASGGRIVMYGIAILAVLGAVFYGLNSASNSNNTASNPPPSTTAQNAPAPSVTPAPLNTTPGTTTGASPTAPRPASPLNNSVTPGSPSGNAGGSSGTN